MSKKTYDIKVPCHAVAVDTQGRRVGAGKPATVYIKEKKRLEKLEIKPIEKESYNG